MTMPKLFRCLMLAAAATGIASLATAGELTVKIADGRATVIAREVPLRQVLAEWARVGNTKVVNGEKLQGGLVTLELVDIPEKDVLDILLRSAAGYMAATRPDSMAGASQYDRVIILATSRAPAATVGAPPQPFNRPVIQQVPQPPPDDDDDVDDSEPGDQGPMPQPGMLTPGVPFPAQHIPPGMDPNQTPVNPPAPMTSPRPGMLPQPQPNPGNPYTPGGRGGPGVTPDDVPE